MAEALRRDEHFDRGHDRRPSHLSSCIVVSSPSGGVGKTTLVTHLAVALLKLGVTVGVADLDVRDRGLSSWIARRRARGEDLVMPAFPELDAGRGGVEVERREFDRWPDVRAALLGACDVVLIDTPAGATPLTGEAMRGSDTIISLIGYNESDLDRLFDGSFLAGSSRPSAYSKLVWEARRRRAQLNQVGPAWFISPARQVDMADADHLRIDQAFVRAERLVGARLGPSFVERPTVRAAFGQGLTALDDPFTHAPMADGLRDELREFLVSVKAPGLAGAALAL